MHTDPRTRRPGTRRTALAVVGAALVTTLAACAGGAAADVPAPPPPQAASDAGLTRADVDAWLDGTVPEALEESRIAGATVAVVHDGEVVTARGFGVADVAAGTPVDPERTLFRVGSVSKMLTATAVMQLVERGEVDLDTDVERYTQLGLDLPHPVTLRHLLTHTAGFEERVAGLIGAEGTTPDLRRSLVEAPPVQVYEPGTTPAYSNYGNALAGYVVEAVSGQPFEQYVAEHVLAPAGMDSSSFAQPLPDDLADDVALGYPTSDEEPLGFEVVGQPPAGAFSATATDMARFMLAHLGHTGEGEGEGEGEEMLSAATRDLMQRPALDADALGALAQGERMGLGWFDESRNGHRVVGHGGDTTAFHSHLQLWPDDDTGVYLSLSSTGVDSAAYLLREDLLTAFADRYFPADEATTSTVDAATRAEHAQALAGSYESTRGFHTTFLTGVGPLQPITAEVVDGDRVRFSPGVGTMRPSTYEEVEPWVYQQVDGDRRLAVRTDDAGRVELVGHDSAMSLAPLTPWRAALAPLLLGGTAVLLLAVLAWPVGALVRRVRARRAVTTGGTVPAVHGAGGEDVDAGTTGGFPTSAWATAGDATGGSTGTLAAAPPTARTAPAATDPTTIDRAATDPAARLRVPRLLTRLAAVAAVLAVALWVYVLLAVLGLQAVPDLLVRGAQALTLVAVLGLVAAGWRVVAEVRARTGWWRVTAATVVLVAFAAVDVAANGMLLLSPDITY
ncbi:serine hydrolase [Cellulomonas sp. JZ18]|uniref:serine hydrolase domain-containing protein n=1 Tax=Cellulomonas sp. JZ18 TaxID=2654191 RepID=UPI0018AFB08F|nr:serine hydrolase domain-containing protein [Cellulomonas sp. JZ18]